MPTSAVTQAGKRMAAQAGAASDSASPSRRVSSYATDTMHSHASNHRAVLREPTNCTIASSASSSVRQSRRNTARIDARDQNFIGRIPTQAIQRRDTTQPCIDSDLRTARSAHQEMLTKKR